MGRLTGELVVLSPQLSDHAVHRRRDTVVVMSRYKFRQRPRIKLTARSLQSTRKTLGFFKDVIWD